MVNTELKKVNSILKLRELGLNLHNTVITKDINEALETARKMGRFTIRTDISNRKAGKWKNGTELPFIIQKEELKEAEDINTLKSKLRDLLQQGYTLIIADGIKYDDIQCYNAVGYIDENGYYLVEISTEKVPLRCMYNKEGIFAVEGNIAEGIMGATFYGKVNYDRHNIINDIGDLYTKGIYKKWMEFTRYPIKLGEREDYFVFWEIR